MLIEFVDALCIRGEPTTLSCNPLLVALLRMLLAFLRLCLVDLRLGIQLRTPLLFFVELFVVELDLRSAGSSERSKVLVLL